MIGWVEMWKFEALEAKACILSTRSKVACANKQCGPCMC